MTTKNKIIFSLLALVATFAAGRYSNQVSYKKDTKTSIVEDKNTQKDTHEKTVTTVVEKPDGEKQTTITQTKDVVATISDVKDTKSETQVSKVTGNGTSKLTISALVGIDIHTKLPTYGASITKDVLGPVSIGVFGLTNGTAGISLGVSF